MISPVLVFAASAVLAVQAQGGQRRGLPGWPCAGTIDPSYVQSAEATGGSVMLFKPEETAGAAAEILASSRHDEIVFRGTAVVGEGTHHLEIPVDSTMESAYFFVSMQCLQKVVVVRPGGDELRTDAAGVEYHHFEATRLVTVPSPAPGHWKVRVTGRGFLSLIVKAKSDLTLGGVTFGDNDVVPKPGRQRLEARTSGEAREIAFELVSSTGAKISSLDLELETETDDRRTYAANVTVPSVPFRVAMIGVDAQGFRFRRLHKLLFSAER
jgi:hypothetical protein